MLDLLDRLRLVYSLDVDRHDLRGFHVQEILQHFIGKIRSRDGQIAHGTVNASHLESTASGKGKGRRRNKILHRKSGLRKPAPVKIKAVMLIQMEHVMHQLQAFLPVQGFGPDAQPAEVVQQVVLHMLEPRLGLPHAVCLNAERQVLCLRQTVISLFQLGLQHLTVFAPDGIKAVFLVRDPDALFKSLRIGRHIQEGQLEMDGAVKEIQKAAPFLENGCLVLILRQLVVDILVMDRLGVIVVGHPADPVREHPLEGDGLLRRARNAVILLRFLDNLPYLFCLTFCEPGRQPDFRRFFLFAFSG